MSHFDRTPEFEKDYKRLRRKYLTLAKDLEEFEKLLAVFPTGTGAKFAILYQGEDVSIVKARLACQALRESSLRVIYAYHKHTIRFLYIEMYFKGDKESEDKERIKRYLETLN